MNLPALRRILCFLRGGQRWRRLTKRERILQPNQGGEIAQYRRCARCGATRLAAKRKTRSNEHG